MPVDGLGRWAFLCAVGAGTLAGCSGLAADEEPDRTVEARVQNKKFQAVIHEEDDDNVRIAPILTIGTWESANGVHHLVQEETEFTSEDVQDDTTIGDLPMPEVYAAMDVTWTFTHVDIHLETRDEINGAEPPDQDGIGYPYMGPTEVFDRIDVGEVHRFTVTEPGDYYSESERGRIVDVIE